MTTTLDTAPPLSAMPNVADRGMNYVECDLNPALTLPQWRQARAAAAPRRRVRLLPARHRTALAA